MGPIGIGDPNGDRDGADAVSYCGAIHWRGSTHMNVTPRYDDSGAGDDLKGVVPVPWGMPDNVSIRS